VKLISTTHTTKFVETEENNQKDETIKKAEITEDLTKLRQAVSYT
jgi:hypothetical protein